MRQSSVSWKFCADRLIQPLPNVYCASAEYVSTGSYIRIRQRVDTVSTAIRMITRIMFVWFIKQKELVPISSLMSTFVQRFAVTTYSFYSNGLFVWTGENFFPNKPTIFSNRTNNLFSRQLVSLLTLPNHDFGLNDMLLLLQNAYLSFHYSCCHF